MRPLVFKTAQDMEFDSNASLSRQVCYQIIDPNLSCYHVVENCLGPRAYDLLRGYLQAQVH